mgnify:CR=1 FL=1
MIIVILCFILVSLCFNRFVLPIVTDMCNRYAVTKINNEINSAADSVISEMNIKTSDFTEEITNTDTSHINLNSLLINSVTNKITARLSENMNELSYHEIDVPIGAFSGLPILSRLGFNIPIHISSMGDAKADYECSLTSAGVNQVSYQVWLNIECNVTVVNPIFGKNLCVKRKLMLVNTIFNGKVPEGYANINLK